MAWDHSQLRLKVHPEKLWDEAVSNIPNIAGSWHSIETILFPLKTTFSEQQLTLSCTSTCSTFSPVKFQGWTHFGALLGPPEKCMCQLNNLRQAKGQMNVIYLFCAELPSARPLVDENNQLDSLPCFLMGHLSSCPLDTSTGDWWQTRQRNSEVSFWL